MPDQKHQETKQNSKEDQLKSEHEVKARQKNETDKQTQLKEELEQKKEKKRKLELTQEMEKKHEKDLKEAEEQDRIKKEEAIKSERQMCPLCGKEYRPIRICTCSVSGGGSGSGGGSDGGSGETEEKSNNDSNAPATFVGKLFEMAGQFGTAIKQAIEGSSLDQKSHQLSRMRFNPEVISELLFKRILLIENSDSGMLTVRLLLSPSTLSDDQRKELKKFIKSILAELDAFKKENGILADCVEKDKSNEYNLFISFPTKPKMYDKFIQLLAEKQLLPMQIIKQQENKQPVYQKDMNLFNLTPFSTKLTYASGKKANLIDEDLIKKEKALSIRPRTPSDGPKPK